MKGQKIVVIFISLFFAILIISPTSGEAYDEIIEIESRPGVVLFSHDIHSSVKCKSCHHSSELNTTIFACRKCHQKSTGKIKHAKEAFHESCIGCHLRDKKENKKTGPAKRCSGCHIRTPRPK